MIIYEKDYCGNSVIDEGSGMCLRVAKSSNLNNSCQGKTMQPVQINNTGWEVLESLVSVFGMPNALWVRGRSYFH